MQPIIKQGMTNKEYHAMKKKTQPGTLDNDSLHMPKRQAKKWTQKEDDAYDKKHGIKEGSKRDLALDRKRGLKAKVTRKKSFVVKHTGTYNGKSNVLGHGGRAAQMKAHGVPGGVIGAIARSEGAAPGGPNYHGKKAKKK